MTEFTPHHSTGISVPSRVEPGALLTEFKLAVGESPHAYGEKASGTSCHPVEEAADCVDRKAYVKAISL